MAEQGNDALGVTGINWKRFLFLALGFGLFLFIYFMPPWKDAVDPAGKAFPLSREGKASIALFLMAGIWWVFEVVPIGVTSLGIGVMQALFAIRPAKEAFREFTGRDVGFFDVPKYLFLMGWGMVFVIWGYLMIFLRPEKRRIEGLRNIVRKLASDLGPMSRDEIFVIFCVVLVVAGMALQSFVPFMKDWDRAAIMLVSTLLFFISGVLTIRELEEMPWNVILLFSGAMSIGFCLWKTGAAQWMAVNWLILFQHAHWMVFVLSIAFFVLLMTNFIMNVAAIAISLPVSLVIARYLGVTPELILYASLVTAGMPFLLLIGAAPNAIAYESRQFSPGEFLRHGIPMSILLMVVLVLFIALVWPSLGMPILVK